MKTNRGFINPFDDHIYNFCNRDCYVRPCYFMVMPLQHMMKGTC